MREGAKTFFNKSINKRWQGVLTEAELAMYKQTKTKVLTPDCARWLELGRLDGREGREVRALLPWRMTGNENELPGAGFRGRHPW